MDWHNTDSESSDTEPEVVGTCFISEEEADRNYELAGTCVDEPKDEINLEQHGYLLNDDVHLLILEVMKETRLGFELADFQMLSPSFVPRAPTTPTFSVLMPKYFMSLAVGITSGVWVWSGKT